MCTCSGGRARSASTSGCERAPQTAASGRSTASRRPTKRRDLWRRAGDRTGERGVRPRAGAQQQVECGRTQAIAGAAYGRERVLWRQAFSARRSGNGRGAARLSGSERARRGVTAACGVFKAAVTGCGMRPRARARLGEAATNGDGRRAASGRGDPRRKATKGERSVSRRSDAERWRRGGLHATAHDDVRIDGGVTTAHRRQRPTSEHTAG